MPYLDGDLLHQAGIRQPDAQFIARAPSDVPLLAAVEAALAAPFRAR